MTNLFLESLNYISEAKISIIMTSYGRDRLLSAAIKSVLGQTFDDFILIIIDDNSPMVNTRTQEVIKDYDKKDERITYFRTETTEKERNNKSTFCRNINYMLRYAQKSLNVDYICYLPCDDTFSKNKLETVVNFLDKTKASSCWNFLQRLDADGRIIAKIPNQDLGGKPIINPAGVLDHSCVTHRLDAIENMPYPYWPVMKATEHVAPDGEFFIKLIKASGPIRCAGPDILGKKLWHGDSIQGRKHGWKKIPV